MAQKSPKPSLEGVFFALGAAALFGASTPFAKLLLGQIQPVLLAGILYLGSGLGLTLWWLNRSVIRKEENQEAKLTRKDLPWLGGAILSGGIVAPVLLMLGLSMTPASSASLLLNLEGVLTATLAWFAFKENYDRRIMLGMLTITVGGLILSWAGRPEFGVPWGSLLIVGACLGWGLDNNLTRKVSASDPIVIAGLKGLVAGIVNCLIAFSLSMPYPGLKTTVLAGVIGLLGYGISLTLFVLSLRHLGAARTGAYFSTAPFIGAIISIVIFHDPLTPAFWLAACLMGYGVWLHLTEAHDHEHTHEVLEHEHKHVHDEHHQHAHGPGVPPGEPHSHWHRHEPITHKHPHYPDIHHRH